MAALRLQLRSAGPCRALSSPQGPGTELCFILANPGRGNRPSHVTVRMPFIVVGWASHW